MNGRSLPHLQTAVPGPESRAWVDRLAQRECPAITARRARRAAALGAADDDPIVWDAAVGANIRDVDGNIFVDLAAGFGVMGVGHRNPAVVAAAQAQADTLLHAMGDACPDRRRIELLEALATLSGLDRAILGSSGADAVEAALKTAKIATGRDGVLAFAGGYHGLSYGTLAATGYKKGAFQAPFAGQLGGHVRHHPYGGALPTVAELADIGAVLVEPIQGRGGMRVPPAGWLAGLIAVAHEAGAVVIFDEIYTGFGRTGTWFRFQAEGVQPDLVCVGKGMGGGFPISACLGRAEVMDAWGASQGEALHTQTFLGNPLGCAMALAAIGEIGGMLGRVAVLEAAIRAGCAARGWAVQGAGLLLGVVLPDAFVISRRLLQAGYLALPAGEHSEVLALTPPFTLTDEQLEGMFAALDAAVGEAG
jgi:acetylornithine/succinyldiaminopimelate/putrescine aminotransferase